MHFLGDRRTRVRGIGGEAVQVAVDVSYRVAYAEGLPDERGMTTAAFLARALAWYAARGPTPPALRTVERLTQTLSGEWAYVRPSASARSCSRGIYGRTRHGELGPQLLAPPKLHLGAAE